MYIMMGRSIIGTLLCVVKKDRAREEKASSLFFHHHIGDIRERVCVCVRCARERVYEQRMDHCSALEPIKS